MFDKLETLLADMLVSLDSLDAHVRDLDEKAGKLLERMANDGERSEAGKGIRKGPGGKAGIPSRTRNRPAA